MTLSPISNPHAINPWFCLNPSSLLPPITNTFGQGLTISHLCYCNDFLTRLLTISTCSSDHLSRNWSIKINVNLTFLKSFQRLLIAFMVKSKLLAWQVRCFICSFSRLIYCHTSYTSICHSSCLWALHKLFLLPRNPSSLANQVSFFLGSFLISFQHLL